MNPAIVRTYCEWNSRGTLCWGTCWSFLDVAKEWKVKEKISTLGTDSARHMVAAARLLPFEQCVINNNLLTCLKHLVLSIADMWLNCWGESSMSPFQGRCQPSATCSELRIRQAMIQYIYFYPVNVSISAIGPTRANKSVTAKSISELNWARGCFIAHGLDFPFVQRRMFYYFF